MRIPSMSRSLVVAAALSAAALPVLLPSPTYAADVAGPATCYLADENGTVIEPRQEYTPREGAGGLPMLPSPVVADQYTLEVSAPAMNFDPDQPDMHFACQVYYAPLGSVRLVDADGTVLATQRYGNDQNDPSRAALTALPALPEGYEIVPGQTIRGFDAAARTVDPNDPANAHAVGANTDIVIRKVTNNPTPEPSSTPSDARPHALGDCDARAFHARDTREADACSEARTHGHGRGSFAGAAALLGLIGAGVIALRRYRA